MKDKYIKILHLEDSISDAELVYIEIMNSFPSIEYTHLENKDELIEALKRDTCQLVLADYNLPSISGLDILKLIQEHQPDTPVIYISGTIDSEKAIELLRAGATDYVMKHNLAKLPLSIKRALKEKKEKLDKENAQKDLLEAQEVAKLGSYNLNISDGT